MKKVVCIVKVGKDTFLKYRLSNLHKFEAFLDAKWPNWRWYNVYRKDNGEQVANFTCKRRFSGSYFWD